MIFPTPTSADGPANYFKQRTDPLPLHTQRVGLTAFLRDVLPVARNPTRQKSPTDKVDNYGERVDSLSLLRAKLIVYR